MNNKRHRLPAVITVTFTLLSVIYLGVIGMLIESARIQGARAQTAQITDMGNISLFGEFERAVFERFGIFALDGAGGTGSYSIDRVANQLKQYLQINANPAGTQNLSALGFDPWMVRVNDCRIKEYTLLTDDGGEPFYQQAVAYMRQTALVQAGAKLLEYYRAAQEMDDKQSRYEHASANADGDMDRIEAQESAKRRELEEARKAAEAAALEGGTELVEVEPEPVITFPNPLPMIRRLKRTDILKLVCQDAPISNKSVRNSQLVSKRRHASGNLPQKRIYSGLVNDLLFREYLLDHFTCWSSDDAESEALEYGLEYIIAGKNKDRDNLKSVVKRLLLLREGCNYAYSVGDEQMNRQTDMAAFGIIGWIGIPELTALLKHALLLAWSYGESLLDVRTLMMGGRVPLAKSAGDWELSLERLSSLDTYLRSGRSDQSKGQNYRGHLRVLLNLQFVSQQKKRGLDLVELSVKEISGLSTFQADHCITAIRDESTYSIPQHYSRISGAFLGVNGSGLEVTVKGGYSYMSGETR